MIQQVLLLNLGNSKKPKGKCGDLNEGLTKSGQSMELFYIFLFSIPFHDDVKMLK